MACQMYEGFCIVAPVLHSAELFHRDVPVIQKVRHILAHVAKASLVFFLSDRTDVHIIGRHKLHALVAAHCLRIEEVELP